jgi:hypothetical protein
MGALQAAMGIVSMAAMKEIPGKFHKNSRNINNAKYR